VQKRWQGEGEGKVDCGVGTNPAPKTLKRRLHKTLKGQTLNNVIKVFSAGKPLGHGASINLRGNADDDGLEKKSWQQRTW